MGRVVVVHVPARALLRRRWGWVVQISIPVSVVEMGRVAGVGMRLRFGRRVKYGRTAVRSRDIRRGHRRWACHTSPIAVTHYDRLFLYHTSVWTVPIPITRQTTFASSSRLKAVSLDLKLNALLFQFELFRAPVHSFSLAFAAVRRRRRIVVHYGRLAVVQRCAQREVVT